MDKKDWNRTAKSAVEFYLEGKTIREVASILGVGKSYVSKKVFEANVSRPRKIRMGVVRKDVSVCPPLNEDFVCFLDGLIMSDGHYKKPSKLSPTSSYIQTCYKIEWLQSIKTQFYNNGINSWITISQRNDGRHEPVLTTNKYEILYGQYLKWYSNGIKRVPKNINLNNKQLLKNWIYGDGTRIGKTLRLCTDSFLEEDIDLLKDKLNYLGFKFKTVFMGNSVLGLKKLRLSICQRDGLFDFLTFVGHCEESCFEYKWKS